MNTTVLNDPIADMLTRIRNAIAVNKHTIVVPHSNIKESVARILVENRFLSGIKVDSGLGRKLIVITINEPNQNSEITSITRLSRPGRRQYVSSDEIPIVKRGRGIVVISTNKGIMTGEKARKQSIGGELICQVY